MYVYHPSVFLQAEYSVTLKRNSYTTICKKVWDSHLMTTIFLLFFTLLKWRYFMRQMVARHSKRNPIFFQNLPSVEVRQTLSPVILRWPWKHLLTASQGQWAVTH
jgi:hypothetical protein